MLHTKFQGHWPFDSGEKDFFFYVLPYMGMVAILVRLHGPFETKFRSRIPWRLHMKFDFD